MLVFYLTISSVTVLFGAGLAIVFREKQTEFRLIFGFTAGAVFGFVLMLMVHLVWEENDLMKVNYLMILVMKVNYLMILVMSVGFLLIWMLEYLTHRIRARFGNQTEVHKKNVWGVNLTLIGLSIHAIVDGFNLSTAAKDPTDGIVLALGVLLHRLPVATVITTALRHNYGVGRTLLHLIPLIMAPFVGAFMGESLQQGVFMELTEYLTAFAVGTLLHVVMDGLRGGCTPSEEKISSSTKIAFVIGLILTLCAMSFIPGLEHEHAH